MAFLPGRRAVLLASLGGILAGCAGALDAFVPESGYVPSPDHAYGSGPRQRLDVYAPEDARDKPAPIVVFFYGGNWRQGDKADYRFVGQAFASRGYVTVVPDYRLFPDAGYPAFLEDAASAVAWARGNARRIGGDPQRIFLMGHSAGAYIAMMAGLDPRWLAGVGLDPGRDIRGVIGLSGPYDFLPFGPDTQRVFAGAPDPRATQPINHVDGVKPPLFLATGERDDTVRPGNSRRLAEAAEKAGGRAVLREYAGVGHIWIVVALAAPLRWLAPVLDDSVRFMEANA